MPAPMSERVLEKALVIARGIEDAPSRAQVLSGLSSDLPEPLRGQMAREALTAALEIEREGTRAQVLAGLAPYLPEELLGETVAAVRMIKDERTQAAGLSKLAARLAELGHPEKALAVARSIDWEYHRAEALFKAVGRALDMATRIDERIYGELPSTKEFLEG